jgi:diguanylate cyclase (GGDEF)-like protein
MIKIRSKELLIGASIFIVVALFTFFFLRYQFQKEQQIYLERNLKSTIKIGKTITQSIANLSDLAFKYSINKDHIIQLLDQANTNKQKQQTIRKELLDLLSPVYNDLQKYQLRQLQIYLPDKTVFLRVHRPEFYADDLSHLRSSIEQVFLEKKIIRTFEEGGIQNGYRNLYPIFYHGKMIAAIEFSYSFLAWDQYFEQLKPGFYLLLVKKKKKKTIVDEKTFYIKSASSRYLWDKEILIHNLKKEYLSKEQFDTFQQHLRKEARLHNLAQPFIFYDIVADTVLLTSVYPVTNALGELSAYSIIITKDQYLKHAIENYYVLQFIGLFSSFLLAFLVTFYIHKKNRFIQTLEELSLKDPLTKIYNRRGFHISSKAIVARAQREKTPYSILFMDIDHFKKVNDTYGHDIGDEVLKLLASILLQHTRKYDITARWGGEEFIILLPNTSEEKAKKVAEKIRTIIENTKTNKLPQFTVSIGVVSSATLPLDTVIQLADEALYEAKESGRNKVVTKEATTSS